jgi:hypothetical protein
MPDLFDYALSAGYAGDRLYVPISYVQRTTRGGGDIRRQDAPFVSNRMNSSRLEALLMYRLPKISRLAVRLEAARTLTGRNVGESTTVGAGLMYLTDFGK